jgi:hypothetical protein
VCIWVVHGKTVYETVAVPTFADIALRYVERCRMGAAQAKPAKEFFIRREFSPADPEARDAAIGQRKYNFSRRRATEPGFHSLGG